MAAIQPVLILSDNGLLVGVEKCSIAWGLGKPEAMSYTVNGAEVTKLTPGVAPSGTRVIAFSLDGGASTDARMLSGGTAATNSVPAEASEQGQSIGQCLQTTHVPRMTAQQILLADVFTGQRGTVRTTSGGVIATGAILPAFQGIGATPIGGTSALESLLGFTWIVDPAVATITLDIDINRDTLDRITQAVTEHLGSLVDPQRAQYVIDSGDYGVAGGRQTVAVGPLGASPFLTFSDFISSATTQPILVGTQVQPQTLQMCRSCSFLGGDTHHGMPDSGRITAVVTVNHTSGAATGDYRSGMPVLSLYGDRYHGGVFYDPGDNALHPMSQAMGVVHLWYDEAAAGVPTLFASTDAGAYSHSADPTDTKLWQRLGGMALKVLKIVSCPDIYALVEVPNSSTRVILKFDPIGGSTGYGFDGWDMIYSADGLFDFSVVAPGGILQAVIYCLATAAPGTVLRHNVFHADTDPDLQIAIPHALDGGTPVGIGLDPLVTYASGASVLTGTYVRTDSGSAGLFYINGAGTNMANASPSTAPGSGLVDSSGAFVQVNQVIQHSPGIIQWDTGARPVAVLAATNRGLFTSSSLSGGPWLPTDGQSNLGDVGITHCASAPPRRWLNDQVLTRFYGVSDRALYKSHNGTVNWVDAFSAPLDAGPAYFALTQAATGLYPNNVSTSLSYGGYTVTRALNTLGEFVYAMVNPASVAPAGADRQAEITGISTPALVPEVPASQLLLDAMARFLAYTARPQLILDITSVFDDTADALRFLRPTHQVTVNGTISSLLIGVSSTPITFVTYSGLVCYVLEHRIDYDASVDATSCTTQTKLGVLCLDDRTDPLKVTADLWYAVSRQSLYRTRGHH
jgi:hypothetical protein